MKSQELSTCKECFSDFPTDEMIWGDKGASYWVCVDCYQPQTERLCGDCLYPLSQCQHDKTGE